MLPVNYKFTMSTNICSDVTTNVIPWNVWHVRSSAVVREAHSPVQRSRTRSRAKVLNLRDMDFAWDDCTFSSRICWYWWHLGGFNKYHISSLSERWCFYCYIWSCRQVSLSSILFCVCNLSPRFTAVIWLVLYFLYYCETDYQQFHCLKIFIS